MEHAVRVAATAEDVAKCRSLRHDVFVAEQQLPADAEDDGQDQDACHLMFFKEDCQLIATGRVLVVHDGDCGAEAVLARVAVRLDQRGRGLGSRVVQELEALAQAKGASKARLTPHYYLEPFYTRMGYQRPPGDGIICLGDQCQLITMEKCLNLSPETGAISTAQLDGRFSASRDGESPCWDAHGFRDSLL